MSLRLEPSRRARLGQFFTPMPLARFLADMFEVGPGPLRLLDPGAGIGCLSAAFVDSLRARAVRPASLHLRTFEVDSSLTAPLRATLDRCADACAEMEVEFQGECVSGDFLEAGARILARDSHDFFSSRDSLPSQPAEEDSFDLAILNPPYGKIASSSPERERLRAIGLETSNLYAGFLAVTSALLVPGGQMVAITPRSFCNGPYFEPFRRFFLERMSFRRIHVFDARDRAFGDDGVLQENVVFHAVKERRRSSQVVVSSSLQPDSEIRSREVEPARIVHPDDPRSIVHIVPENDGEEIARAVAALPATLADLGVTVSTGRVVSFRSKEHLRDIPGRRTVPLLHPCHVRRGYVEWPGTGRKPCALARSAETSGLETPSGNYALVRRFSAKEEKRRIVAALVDPARTPGPLAFENHLNYFHADGAGLEPRLARGLVAYLNSTVVDAHFRQFSGHTQVNASDLRAFRYPSRAALVRLGGEVEAGLPGQDELDRLVAKAMSHD